MERSLAVIGSNPATTSGVRTLNRAKKASSILGFETFVVTNLLDVPTYRTGNISEVAKDREAWVRSRANLYSSISNASGVLLAYGIEKPSGAARKHYLDQIAWLNQELLERDLPTWAVGGQPRHPSRWQRFTCRAHPGIDFDAALMLSLRQITIQPKSD